MDSIQSESTLDSALPTAARRAILPTRLEVIAKILVLVFVVLFHFLSALKTALVFAYSCFLQPIGKVGNQRERLDRFYGKQATVYDTTRSGLLRGRKTMLRLCAAQLCDMQRTRPGKPLVWVDIGGGSGWNIEQMAEYFPLEQLSEIYLIDLCEPLLQVARQRFAPLGFKNVQVLCQDAKEFHLPGFNVEQKVDVFTCSYSISMIPLFYAVLDRIIDFLDPETGILGVCDFYVSGSNPVSRQNCAQIGGDLRRQCGWLSRFFWSQWFELDHVELHPARRDYLEYKFGTIKCFNGRNNLFGPFIVRIPYYVWIGCSRQRDASAAIQAFEVEDGDRVTVPPSSPELSFSHSLLARQAAEDAEKNGYDPSNTSALEVCGAGLNDCGKLVRLRQTKHGSVSSKSSNKVCIDLASHVPLSSFHYQKHQWRMPYIDPDFASFRSFIYGFTWEDPYIDMQHLRLGKNDSILCITSAGDNALHYAVAAEPKRIHCVDMNACQGHLLELKLACIASLDHNDFWSLFGAGRNPDFRDWLDTRISPYLSSHAYQFWRLNNAHFDHAFYFRGYTGHALRLTKVVFALYGVQKHVTAFCEAETLAEQQEIWDKHLRSTMINRKMTRLFLSNHAFLWNALGVPMNQYKCFRNEGQTVEQFVIDTLDSLPSRALLRDENYHYKLCLQGSYSHGSCPLYLKREAYQKLKRDSARLLDSFRLHTDSIVNVLRGLQDASLTRAIIMDHMDWYDPISDSQPAPSLEAARVDSDKSISDLDREIVEMSRVLALGGMVFWRSAAKVPWYNQRFEKMGFRVEAIHIRKTGKAIDNVNMYASFYKGTRV